MTERASATARALRALSTAGDHVRWWRLGTPHGWLIDDDIRRLLGTTIRTIVDVGANKGQSARRFRRYYPAARLYCFEPGADYPALENAVRGWPAIRTYRIALGAARGRGTMAGHGCLSRLTPGDGPVQIETFDEWADEARLEAVDYLKVDTEGRDLEVLRGAERRLGAGSIGLVEVESGLNPDNELHVPDRSFREFLEPKGYRLFGVYEQTLEWPSRRPFLRRANLVFIAPRLIEENRWT